MSIPFEIPIINQDVVNGVSYAGSTLTLTRAEGSDLTTTIATSDPTKIENGNSSMEIASANGDCVFTPNGLTDKTTTFAADGDVTVAGRLLYTRVEIPDGEDAFIEPETDNEGVYAIGRNESDAVNRGLHFRKVILQCGYNSGEEGQTTGDMYFIRNGTFRSWTGISSDSRIKENQTEYKIEDSMNIIKSLKVKKYFNIDSQKEEIGLIAQEVEKLLPDAVTISDLSDHNKHSDFRFLDYDKVLVHTLGAIQLLEERLAALENK